MAVTAPTFADIDFGFDHGSSDDYLSICVAAVPGAIATRTEPVAFLGVSGVWMGQYGTGSMRVIWDVVTWFKTEAVKTAFEQSLEEKAGKHSEELSIHGRTYDAAVLKSFKQIGKLLPQNYPWLFGKRYIFEFEVLDPVTS